MYRAGEGQGRDGTACWEDVDQDCTCPPTAGSQPAPAPHLEKQRANTADCKKGVVKGLAPREMCGGHCNGHGDAGGVQLYGLPCYLWGKGGLRRSGMISLAGWPGGVLIFRNGFYWT